MLPKDTYAQPETPDPVLDPETVLRLVRRHVPGASAVLGVDESGGEARTYAVDDGLILKTQRPHRLRPRTSLEKEAFFLRQLADVEGVSVPKVLGYGREGGIEYCCMSRMPGVAASTLAVAGEARMELLRDLGRMLRRVHQVPQAPFWGNPLFLGPRDNADFMRRLEAGFDEAVSILAGRPGLWPLKTPPQEVAGGAMQAMPADFSLVAVHSNPGPEHVFVDPATSRLTGVIDFGDAYIAHPAFDWRWPTPEDRLAVLDGYGEEGPLPGSFRAAWRVVQVFMEMTALATRPERRETAAAHLAHLVG